MSQTQQPLASLATVIAAWMSKDPITATQPAPEDNNMAAITMKDFPDDVYRQLKIRAAEQGITLRALITETLAASVAKPAAKRKPTAADESPATPAAKTPAGRRSK